MTEAPTEIARHAARRVRPGGTLLLIGGTGVRRVSRELGIVSVITAAMPMLVATLALEIAPVRVNLLAPGFVDTSLSASLLGEALEDPDAGCANAPHPACRQAGGRCGARRTRHGQHRSDGRHT